MSGKPSLKNELIEELMEAASFYSNFANDMSEILNLIDISETEDHSNDKMRTEVQGHLLSALRSFSFQQYEDVDRHVHAAIQRLHMQEISDLKDDRPRTEAKIQLSLVHQKAILNQKIIIKLIDKFQRNTNAK